jgi:2-polyprenyl-6-methoxyphenol hydroxylase-like FAD-dependent oxidoreductase
MFTALLLAQDGIKTRLIDQESRTAEHSYSCALHPCSIKLLRQVGLAYEAIQSGQRIDSVGFYQENARRAEVRLSELPMEFPFALVLEQSALEKLLEEKLRQVNVTIDWNHRLAGLEMNDRGVTATVEKLVMTGKGYGVPDFAVSVEKSVPAHARFVVGADGSNSLVRRQLGIEFERAGDPQHFAVYEIEASGVCGSEAKVVLDDSSTSVLWPLSEARCRWSFQVAPDKAGEDFPQKERNRMVVVESPSEQDSLHRLHRLLEDRAPWFENLVEDVVWATDVQFEPRLARQFGRDFCWLVGDAAHQTGPVGMQSMNVGFREAADLARALTQILRKGGSAESLRGYESVYRCGWRQLLDFTTRTPVMEAATEWARQRVDRIVGSLPASGADLICLMKQLGIDF